MSDPQKWLPVEVSERAEEPDRATLAEPEPKAPVPSASPGEGASTPETGSGSASAAPSPEVAAIREALEEMMPGDPHVGSELADGALKALDTLAAALERVTAERKQFREALVESLSANRMHAGVAAGAGDAAERGVRPRAR